MVVLLLLFFICYVFSVVYFIYKLKVQDDDINTLYDNYFKYIEGSFRRGDKDDA